jgi:hypothetical protein
VVEENPASLHGVGKIMTHIQKQVCPNSEDAAHVSFVCYGDGLSALRMMQVWFILFYQNE